MSSPCRANSMWHSRRRSCRIHRRRSNLMGSTAETAVAHSLWDSQMKRLISVLVLMLGASVWGQDSSALINQALDGQVKPKMVLDGPLPQVMKKISQDTGVKIQEDPIIWDLLPW